MDYIVDKYLSKRKITQKKASVFDGYVSRFGKIGKEINIAPDRIVTLEEDGLIVDISKYIIGMKIKELKK